MTIEEKINTLGISMNVFTDFGMLKDEYGSFIPSTINISFENSLLNHKLDVYMKARKLQENLTNDTERFSNLNYDCQYYFGVIYETECEWLHWFDKRSTNHWANGRLTELNAGYLDETMYFEVNSYNNMNLQRKKTLCKMSF